MRSIVIILIFLIQNTAAGGILDVFTYILENAPHPSGESEEQEPTHYEQELEGSGICAQLAGCTTYAKGHGCYSVTNTAIDPGTCEKCFVYNANKKNILRADFYDFDLTYINKCNKDQSIACPNIKHLDEMADFMLVKDDEIAITYQGALWKNTNMPEGLNYHEHYKTKFCDETCLVALRSICSAVLVVPKLRNWCLTALELIEDKVEKLVGPPSFILFLAARVGTNVFVTPPENVKCGSESCTWPKVNLLATVEERGVFVASAASSVLLAGKWWKNVDIVATPNFKDFGFAVQHSLMIAIFAGRLRLTLQKNHKKNQLTTGIVPGTSAVCSEDTLSITENFEGETGTVFAAICSLFYSVKMGVLWGKLRYRPEVHVMNDQGCAEKTSGMVFIRPGDWVVLEPKYSTIGSNEFPLGVMFYDSNNLTTIEFTNTGATLYPPSAAVSLKNLRRTMCTDAKGNGPNYAGLFNVAGLHGIGGMCNWVPVW